MSPESMTTKEPLHPDLTQAQIEMLTTERRGVGATSCKVVAENGQRFLVCEWPPL